MLLLININQYGETERELENNYEIIRGNHNPINYIFIILIIFIIFLSRKIFQIFRNFEKKK